jgi:hypothetical protein
MWFYGRTRVYCTLARRSNRDRVIREHSKAATSAGTLCAPRCACCAMNSIYLITRLRFPFQTPSIKQNIRFPSQTTIRALSTHLFSLKNHAEPFPSIMRLLTSKSANKMSGDEPSVMNHDDPIKQRLLVCGRIVKRGFTGIF